MRNIWRGIFRYWTRGDKVGFFVIIFCLIIVVISVIVSAVFVGKLLSTIALSQRH